MLSLQSATLGLGCMLCPTLTGCASDSGKYILLMMSAAALDTLRAQLVGTFADLFRSVHRFSNLCFNPARMVRSGRLAKSRAGI
jgi:hypothetical protein